MQSIKGRKNCAIWQELLLVNANQYKMAGSQDHDQDVDTVGTTVECEHWHWKDGKLLLPENKEKRDYQKRLRKKVRRAKMVS